jgi:hypothetical protein
MISSELRGVLRRLKLGQMLDTLPERLTLARQNHLPRLTDGSLATVLGQLDGSAGDVLVLAALEHLAHSHRIGRIVAFSADDSAKSSQLVDAYQKGLAETHIPDPLVLESASIVGRDAAGLRHESKPAIGVLIAGDGRTTLAVAQRSVLGLERAGFLVAVVFG